MLHHQCTASRRHMADNDVDAEVSAASQHPRLSRGAILLSSSMLIDSRSIPLFILPPPSVSCWRTTEYERTSSLCAAAEAAPESLLTRRILHVWMRRDKGCCRLTKDKVTHTKPVCCGHPRRRNQGILALFWMGRGLSLCGRRVWVAEVRRGSSDLFFMAQHRGTPWQRQTAIGDFGGICGHLFASDRFSPLKQPFKAQRTQFQNDIIINYQCSRMLKTPNRFPVLLSDLLSDAMSESGIDGVYVWAGLLRCGKRSKMEEAIFTRRGCRCLKCPLIFLSFVLLS